MAGKPELKNRVAKEKRDKLRTNNFIAAAKVERAVCACRVAIDGVCVSFVHVFNRYVASLSVTVTNNNRP